MFVLILHSRRSTLVAANETSGTIIIEIASDTSERTTGTWKFRTEAQFTMIRDSGRHVVAQRLF
jgi:hypothetical protein